MAGYIVANFSITNQAGYQEYLAAVGPTLKAHNAERIFFDRDSELLEGSAGQVTFVARFATKAAARFNGLGAADAACAARRGSRS